MNYFWNVWLGATEKDSLGTWKWVTGEAWTFTDWYPGEPNSSSENYLGFASNYQWNDFANNAGTIQGFLLEIE